MILICKVFVIKLRIYHLNEYFRAQNVEFSQIVVECHNLIRKFAYKQLKCFEIEDSEAKLRANSCVSQRDIQVWTMHQ